MKYREPHPAPVPEEAVTFERITKVYREESQKKTLTALEPDFWDKVARYVAGLEADLAAARAKDPNSKAALLLLDELRKVQQRREQIYQYRERKVTLLASQVASGSTVEPKGLTRPEQEFLGRLVDLLKVAREAAYGTAASSPSAPPSKASSEASRPPARTPPAQPQGVLLHILEDVPPFAGRDGTYRLKKEDLVTVEPSIAKVLVERGKARPVAAPP